MKRIEESVETLRPDGRRGVLMSKEMYDTISSFILSALHEGNNNTLTDVLETARHKLTGLSGRNLAWSILQVKLDLEARGFIKSISPANQRVNHIKLTRQGTKKLQFEREPGESGTF